MRSIRLIAAMAALSIMLSVGCSKTRASNPSVKKEVQEGLKQNGFNKINVDEDRSKGVITLKGDVATQDEKNRAEEVARQASGADVIANELLVTEGDKGRAKDVAGATDDAIEARFKEWVEKNNMKDQHIRADAKNGVLTLTGDVETAAMRTHAEKDSAKIAGVTEVVNKLEVKGTRKGDTRHVNRDVTGH